MGKQSEKAAKGKQGKDGAEGDATLPSVASHPRAGVQVPRAKAWGGLLGFGFVAALSWRAHVPGADLLARAIVGGVVGYVVTWAAAVVVWRHLVIAELRAVRAHRLALAERRRRAAG